MENWASFVISHFLEKCLRFCPEGCYRKKQQKLILKILNYYVHLECNKITKIKGS